MHIACTDRRRIERERGKERGRERERERECVCARVREQGEGVRAAQEWEGGNSTRAQRALG